MVETLTYKRREIVVGPRSLSEGLTFLSDISTFSFKCNGLNHEHNMAILLAQLNKWNAESATREKVTWIYWTEER